MKIICSILAFVLIVARAYSAEGALDFQQATTAYCAAFDLINKDLPRLDSPQGTANALDLTAAAITKLSTAMVEFAKKNPELIKQSQPPAELVSTFKALNESTTKYAPLIQTLVTHIKMYRTDPQVFAASQRFIKACQIYESQVKGQGMASKPNPVGAPEQQSAH